MSIHNSLIIFINNLSQVLGSIESILGQLTEVNDFLSPQKQTSEETKLDASEVVIESSQPQNEIVSNKERLTYLYWMVKNYCWIVWSSSKKIDEFLELDISSTITTLAYLRKAIIIGGSEVYAQRLKDDFDLNKESIEVFDQEIEKCKTDNK